MSVAVFIFVLVAGNAIKEVLGLLASGRLDWGTFFYLMVVLIPRVLPNALPFGILTGVLLVMGRMSAQGEILAMKAAGISLYRIAAPIILIAIGGTFLALGINFYYGPVADTLYKSTLRNVVRDDPLRFFQEKTFIKDFPGLVLYFQTREGSEVIKPYIWVIGPDGMLAEFIKGETGTVTLDESDDALVLTVYNASGERRGGDDAENLDEQYTAIAQEVAFRISLDGLFGSKQTEKKLSHMTLNELLGERQRAIDNPNQWEEKRRLERQNSIQVTLQKKAAMAFAVLSLCAIAIPLGIKASRSETYANLAIALGLALTYFFLLVVVSWLEKQPALRPDLLIWVPNLLYQALGFYLLSRVNRH